MWCSEQCSIWSNFSFKGITLATGFAVRGGSNRSREGSQKAVAKTSGRVVGAYSRRGDESRRLREDSFAGRARERCGGKGPLVPFQAVGFQFL